MSSNGEMKISLKLIIYAASVKKSGSLFFGKMKTDVLMTKMLKQLQLAVGSLGQDGGTEGLHDFLDSDWLRCQLVLRRTI